MASLTMSYYFCIVGTKDNPLFELEFGTSKQGGDGVARFSAEARSMNPFIVHSSLDIVDELQWLNNQMCVYSCPLPIHTRCSPAHCRSPPFSNPSKAIFNLAPQTYASCEPRNRYLKRIDHFASSHISAFLTPTSTKFLLLHLPHPPNTPPTSLQTPTSFSPFGPYTSTPQSSSRQSSSSSASSSGSTSIANNPTSPQTEEAIRQFFGDVFEVWLKAVMNPFCGIDTTLDSPVFRARVLAAGKKYL